MEIKERIKELVGILNNASAAYYNTDNPMMSDTEFDCLIEELKMLENESGFIMANSPTHNPGTQIVSEINKIIHEHPMLSLDKVHTVKEIKKFIDNNDCVFSVKLDGLSLSATYIDGELARLETRGNGTEGSSVIIHASSITNLPKHINVEGKYVIDGECIIPYDVFNKYNDTLPEDKRYANPRNLASGTLSLLDNSISRERGLQFWAWNVIYGNEDVYTNSLFKNLSIAYKLGFDVSPHCKYPVYSTDVNLILDQIKTLASDSYLPMDGCVISCDDIEYGKSLGRTDKFFRNAIAYKYEDNGVETELIDITYDVSKTGILTPVAIFKPVEIDGTIVERASLCNMGILRETLGEAPHRFQKINVIKANMIIPKVVWSDKCNLINNDTIYPPTVCPVCGSLTEIIRPNQTELLSCSNENCKGKLLGKLSHFVSKSCLNIDGLSDATLELLYTNGYINSYKDIYHLKDTNIMSVKIPGLGKKSKENLLQAIENSRETELYRFIASLNIQGVGVSAAKDMANKLINEAIKHNFGGCKYGDLNNWFMETLSYNNAFKNNGYQYWVDIEGIGDKTAESIINFFEENWNMVNELVDEFVFIFEDKANENVISSDCNKLGNKTFCITGSLTILKNRDDFIREVEKNGGKYINNVSAKLDYLVINDLNSTSSKANKARQLGVKLIDENIFLEMINN